MQVFAVKFFFFFFLFRAAPVAYGSFQPSQIGAAAETYDRIRVTSLTYTVAYGNTKALNY